MTTYYRRLGLALCLAGFLSLPSLHAADLYYFIKEIRVGGEGGWDYLSIDVPSRRLYVTHSTKVIVIDTDKDEVVGQITGTPGVHGFAVASALHRGFSSNGRANNVSIINLETLKTTMKVETGENPDCIIYEPGRQEVYAFNGRGNSATVIDAATGKMELRNRASSRQAGIHAAADPVVSQCICNIEDKNEIVSIDTTKHEIANTWPIAPVRQEVLREWRIAHRASTVIHRLPQQAHGDDRLWKRQGSGHSSNHNWRRCQCVLIRDHGIGLCLMWRRDSRPSSPRKNWPGQNRRRPIIEHAALERAPMALDSTTHKIYLAAVDYESQENQPEEQPRASSANDPEHLQNPGVRLEWGGKEPINRMNRLRDCD